MIDLTSLKPGSRKRRPKRRAPAIVAVTACAYVALPGVTWAAPTGGSPSQVDIDLDLCGTTLGVLGQTLGSCEAPVPDEPQLPQDPLDLLDGVLGGDLPADGPIVDVDLAGRPIATVNQPGQDQFVDLALLRDSEDVDDIADVEVASEASDGRLLDGSLLRGDLGEVAVDGGADTPANATANVRLCGTGVGILGSASATCPTAASGSGNGLSTCDSPTQLLGCGSPLGFVSSSSLCGIGVVVGNSFGTSCLADVPEGAGPTTPGTTPPTTTPSSTSPGGSGGGDGAGDRDDGAPGGATAGRGDDGAPGGATAGRGDDGSAGAAPNALGAGIGTGAPAQVGDLPVTGSAIGLLIVFASALVISGLVAWKFKGVKFD